MEICLSEDRVYISGYVFRTPPPSKESPLTQVHQLCREAQQSLTGFPAREAPGPPHLPFGKGRLRSTPSAVHPPTSRAALLRAAAVDPHKPQRPPRPPNGRPPQRPLTSLMSRGSGSPARSSPPGTALPPSRRRPLRSGAPRPARPAPANQRRARAEPLAPPSERARRPLAAAAAEARQRVAGPRGGGRPCPPQAGTRPRRLLLGRAGRAEVLGQDLPQELLGPEPRCMLVLGKEPLRAAGLLLSPQARHKQHPPFGAGVGGVPEHPYRGKGPSPREATATSGWELGMESDAQFGVGAALQIVCAGGSLKMQINAYSSG